MKTAVEQGAALIGREVKIGKRQGKIEAVRKGRPLTDIYTEAVDSDTVQFQLRLAGGRTWWSDSYPRQESEHADC
ncbi:hypothetical protein HA052_15910 [Chromobacterium haemolyticum]|uniref:Uncharacterized protein n=1 Tax=Chromobacterium fluminis TaxID=3044269 RepID=A0ABX0LAX4_9NEIS|nr:hypothetical protein [Chromobacterium haemolyticum]NHR06674.1 hypothetical protein [Chromobacterium haemolyticum]